MSEPTYSAPSYLDSTVAPLPTPRTLRGRRNPFYQLWRFLVFNVKMIGMILHGAH